MVPNPDACKNFDVLVIGAGAAGMMCAAEAGQRGRRVLLLDHAQKPGQKIRISGGGRCNFTNRHASPLHFLSQNPHFCRSALSRFTAADFIARVEARGIAYHEKKLGQLFCDGSAQAIIDMLVDDCRAAGVEFAFGAAVKRFGRDEGFWVETESARFTGQSLVIATGGKSIPKLGATGFGYDVAQRFGIPVITPRPGLVPLTVEGGTLKRFKSLAGVALPVRVHCGKGVFEENLLFTHRGLSGPAILQISSYWQAGESIRVDFAPDAKLTESLLAAKAKSPKQTIGTLLNRSLPQRTVPLFWPSEDSQKPLGEVGDRRLRQLAESIHNAEITPNGSEGYRKAEVTLGGVDTQALSSKTMMSREVPGLFFIGEVVDVTGYLGGFNFQWAWASGHAAGQVA